MLYRDLIKLDLPLSDENHDQLKSKLKNISYSYIYSYDFSKQKNILSKDEWKALTDLRNDDSIIITKPDKGNGVVITSRLDYLNKMKHLISDTTKFKELRHNPTKSREESLSTYLRKLRKDKIIDDATFYKILPNGSSPGVLYGLPKVHKTGCPFRPIVHRLTPITTISLLTLFLYFSQSRPTNTLSKTLSASRIGPKSTSIRME